MSTVKISIIVPVYNVELYIEKCLYRLARQTIKNYEVIIVNDGSLDNSQKIIDSYVKKYPNIFKSYIKKNGGVSSARNFGLKKAIGDFIGFVDSDDYVEFEMFEKLYNKAVTDNCDIAICGINRLLQIKKSKAYEDNNFIEKPFLYDNPDIFKEDNYNIKHIIHCIKPYLWNKIFKKELFDDVSFPVGQIFEDDAIVYKIILRSKKIGLVNELLYNYYVQRSGAITNKLDNSIFDIVKACKSIVQSFKDEGVEQDYFEEMEYLCVLHISARIKKLMKHRYVYLTWKFVNKAFKYLNKNFPEWRLNKYYICNRIPILVKHPLNDYQSNRDSALRIKLFILFKPLIIKKRKIIKFLVRCFVGIEKLMQLIEIKQVQKVLIRQSMLTPEQTCELQQETLALLKKFDSYCEKNKLQYFLSEGSLLGAVRHQGFIPWDDDIDLMMPRKDYERFISGWGSDIRYKMKLFHHSTYNNYYLPFAKLVSVGNTKFESLIRLAHDEYLGPSIDIFPLDSCVKPDDIDQIKLCRKIRKYRNAVLTRVGYKQHINAKIKYFWLSRLFTTKHLLSKIDKLMRKYNCVETHYIANYASSYPISKECFEKKWFEETKRVPFEDMMVNVPSGFDSILKRIYGKYTELPPIENRINRHSYKYISSK